MKRVRLSFAIVTAAILIVGGNVRADITAFYYDQNGQQRQYFTGTVVTRTDANIDFRWRNGSPAPGIGRDDFSIRWMGEVLIPNTGNYRFQTRSDDGVRLWIDGQLVVDNWTDHGPRNDTSAQINLRAGERYSVKMEFYERGGGAEARLRWRGPRINSYRAIPAGNLFTDSKAPTLSSASFSCARDSLTLTFSESLDPATAQNTSNYAIDKGVSITAATLSSDGASVTLTTSRPLGAFNYTITVNNVQDLSGNSIAANSQVGATLSSGGIQATYFDQNRQRYQFFTGSTVVQTEATINYNWGRNSPVSGIGRDDFSVRWEGNVLAPTTGNYTFRTRSDDGIRLWVDGNRIINNWTNHGPRYDSSSPVALTGGQSYPFTLEFYERGGGAVAQLQWSGPSISMQTIPAQNFVSSCTVTAAAQWLMDESAWNGSYGEVADASGNGHNGQAFNGATTQGSTCYYGSFDGVDDYVEIPHSNALNGHDGLTYMAWIRADQWTGINQIMAKSVHGGGSGRAQMGLFSEGGVLKGRAETLGGRKEVATTLPLTAGNWNHVALVFDGENLTIYIDGAFAASSSFAATSLVQTTDPLNISKRVGTNQYYFDGLMDDMRLYTQALTQQEILDIIAATTICPIVSGVDHYAVSANTSALTCEPVSVTVSGHDASDALMVPGNGTTISLSTSDNIGRWTLPAASPGTLVDNGNGSADYTFAANSLVTLSYSHPSVASAVSINVNASSSPNESVAEDPAIDFHDSGFRIVDAVDNPIGTQTAKRVLGDYYLQAVRTDDATQQCVAAFASPSTINVEVGAECISPGICSPSLPMTLGYDSGGSATSSVIATSHDDGGSTVAAYTTLAMDFAAEAKARITINFPDAGNVQLHARYEILDDDGNGLGSYILGASSFLVVPAGICVQSTDPLAACASANTSCSVLRAAGHAAANQFNLQISGRAWGGVVESDSEFCDNDVTPNFQAGPINLSSNVVEPALIPPNDGSLGETNATITENGLVNINQSISEVGVFTFTAGQYTYSGETIAASTSANIGRFTPDHFAITPISIENRTDSNTQLGCGGTFTFLHEQLTLNFGIAAQNSENDTTFNYTGDFALLNGTPGTGDLTGMANDHINLVVYDGAVGHYEGERLAGVNPLISMSDGEQSSTSLVFAMNRSGSPGNYLPEIPFINVQLGLNAVDSDGVQTEGGGLTVTMDSVPVDFTEIGTTNFYYGRVVVENAYGSELRPLPMWAHTEYCSAVDATPVCTNWVDLNRSASDDACSRLRIDAPTPDATLLDYWDGSTSYSVGADALFRVNDVDMQRGGGSWRMNNVGPASSVMVPALGSETLETYHPYLILKQGEASFGTYRGNDRIIYWQELVQ